MSERWILAASPTSCISGHEPWPGMVATYHGSDRRIFAKTFTSHDAAEAWRVAKNVSPSFTAEVLQ